MSDQRKGPFLVQYRYKGGLYNLPLSADSWEDAEARLKALAFGEVVGSNVTNYRVNSFTLPFVGLWFSLMCWWRNRGGRR